MTVYIFGAGASIGALPLGIDLPTQLAELATKDGNFKVGPSIRRPILWLAREAQDWLVDDAAQRLYKSFQADAGARQKYNQLKLALSAALLYWQLTSEPDRRYHRFFNNFPNKRNGVGLELPKIKVISWNYDMQFEIAYATYSNLRLASLISPGELNIVPCAERKSFEDQLAYTQGNHFSLVKLNGTAGYIEDSANGTVATYVDNTIEEIRKNCLNLIQRLNELTNVDGAVASPWLSFAWESTARSLKLREVARDIAKTAEKIIIVGYSFPKSNDEVDRFILESTPNLKKIVINVPDTAEYLRIKEKLQRIQVGFGGMCEHLPNVQYFPDP